VIYRTTLNAAGMISPKIFGIGIVVAFVAGSFVASPELRAYAANTVFSTDIVDGEVKTADLAGNAVTSAKIKDGEVKTEDIAAGAVGSLRIKDNDVKTQDIQNGAVTKAKLGSDVLDRITVTRRDATSNGVGAGSSATTAATCLSDEVATGGGYSGFALNNGLQFQRSFPDTTNGWRVEVANPTGSTQYYSVFVVCAKLAP
jgi:hypothetical protein